MVEDPKSNIQLLLEIMLMGVSYKDVDIETKLSSLRTISIRRFLDNSFHAWKAIPYSLLS